MKYFMAMVVSEAFFFLFSFYMLFVWYGMDVCKSFCDFVCLKYGFIIFLMLIILKMLIKVFCSRLKIWIEITAES